MKHAPGYIVVIGASAGGFFALQEFVSHLSPDTDAAFFVVLHISGSSISGFLAHKLQERTQLKCVLAMDGMPIQKGYIYVAMPNQHLAMNEKEVVLSNAASENRWRPSIDVLFRSAATYFTNRVIGIVLTGLLNDGTTGMSGIKRSGGTTIVQDPNEAEYPDMPFSVIHAMEVDHVVPISEMGSLIKALTQRPIPTNKEVPKDLIKETEIFEKLSSSIKSAEEIGHLTPYTCPDCGGVLFRHDEDAIVKYKCHVGHSYTTRELINAQKQDVENSLWYAIRSLEQRADLLESLAERYQRLGNKYMATDYRKRVEDIRAHVENLKKVIAGNNQVPDEI